MAMHLTIHWCGVAGLRINWELIEAAARRSPPCMVAIGRIGMRLDRADTSLGFGGCVGVYRPASQAIRARLRALAMAAGGSVIGH